MQPEDWERLGKKDMEDPRFDYEAELKAVKADILDEISLDRRRERFEALQRGMAMLSQKLSAVNPDCVVMVSNLHGDIPAHQQQIFSVFTGDQLPSYGAPAPSSQLPTEPDLAKHLVETLNEDGFDVCGCPDLGAASGIGDAFTFLYELYAQPGTLPMVPVMISRYLPNQPSPRRAHALGAALRDAIQSWGSPKRVAIMASGGLSHQILDEPLDREVVRALTIADTEALCSIPRDRLNRGPGTPEILNWVALSAAMNSKPMTLIDYVPCYRSPAGTGHGITFGYWD